MKDCLILKNNDAQDYWLGLGEVSKLDYENPLAFTDDFFKSRPELLPLHLFRKPEYIAYAAWVLCGIKLGPFQQVMLRNLWEYRFPMLIATRGGSKTFILALYSLLRCALFPEYRVIVAGAAFRQSKLVFNYCEQIWNKSPVLRSVCDASSGVRHDPDMWMFRINGGYIYAIPIGASGDKIRGLRGDTVIAEEFASHNPKILEEVVFGFGVVTADPMEAVIEEYRKQYYRDKKIKNELEVESGKKGNQLIITGTADYYFNHFYDYWKKYKKIIMSRGDKNKLSKIFEGDIPKGFDWRHYCIVRIPYSALPKGFMDDAVIARAKAQMTKSMYQKEFEAVFIEDSDGFFKRSLIEGCIASKNNIERFGDKWVPWCMEPFDATLRGDESKKYVYAIDPASEKDNLALAIIEVHPDHRRLVYMWTTNRKNFAERRKMGTTECTDYYDFVNRKVRELMKVFPCSMIGIDTQGGGYSLMESMQSESTLKDGESPILQWIDPDKEKESDEYPGHHLIYPLQFSNYDFLVKANWGLKSDMETRKLLLPRFDALSIELSVAQDVMRSKAGAADKVFDSLEDCVLEIEEMKNELTLVVHEVYGSGNNVRQRWLVPTVISEKGIKQSSGKKDRYTALMMANHVARSIELDPAGTIMESTGDLLFRHHRSNKDTPMYSGPSWFTSKVNNGGV